jgi:hypothetical protein
MRWEANLKNLRVGTAAAGGPVERNSTAFLSEGKSLEQAYFLEALE